MGFRRVYSRRYTKAETAWNLGLGDQDGVHWASRWRWLPGVSPDDVEHSCPCVHGPSWKPKWFSFLAKSPCEHWEWMQQVTIWAGGWGEGAQTVDGEDPCE